jgi:hypothetical protein
LKTRIGFFDEEIDFLIGPKANAGMFLVGLPMVALLVPQFLYR